MNLLTFVEIDLPKEQPYYILETIFMLPVSKSGN
jgi:hypothetical protein